MELVGNHDQFLMELPFYEEALNLFNRRTNDQIYADEQEMISGSGDNIKQYG